MKRSIVIKVTAFILCTLSLMVAALSVLGVIGIAALEFYTRPLDEIRKTVLYNTMREYANDAAARYHHYSEDEMDSFTKSKNLYFEIRDRNGVLVYSNLDGQQVDFSRTFDSWIEEYIYHEIETGSVDEGEITVGDAEYDTTAPSHELSPDTAISETIDPENVTDPAYESTYDPHEHNYYYDYDESWGWEVYEYQVTVHLPAEYFTTDRISFIDYWITTLYQMKNSIYIIGGAALLLFVIFLVVLCVASGWKKGENKPRTCLFDKIPFDLFTFIYAFVFGFAISFLSEFYFEGYEFVIAVIVAIIIGAVLIVSYLFSLAARAKTGELFKNTLIWLVLKNIIRVLKLIFRGAGKVMGDLPLFGKTVLLIVISAIWSIITMFFFTGNYEARIISIILWLLGGTILSIIALYITYGFDKLYRGGERIASGDIAHRINTDHMLPALRHHAESLNNIGGGMSVALEARLKSERFKTELITNVSHDLKTPLTSIVNYVDLIKTERALDVPDEGKISEYIDVLDRQSERLRKLTEDLVEASKAQTGNLEVNPAPIELGEMIAQTQGEYAEKLGALGLELIVRRPENAVGIMADGKHIWRIFDNLMNNIGKYALEGTRVYIDVSQHEGRAYVIFRNTSKYELNISPDELTERFVRGDSSRHTQGSGLGLSIARSLAELNGGKLEIFIDGDLFKVVVSFEVNK